VSGAARICIRCAETRRALANMVRRGRALGALAAAVAATLLLLRYETRFAPVVTDFRMTRVGATADAVTFTAELRKARDCEFVAFDLLVGDPWDSAKPRERLEMRFDVPGSGSENLEPGRQGIGPFTISRPRTEAGPVAFLRVRHRCHPFWITEGVYYVEQRDLVFPRPPE
jgi:hypothetical protein